MSNQKTAMDKAKAEIKQYKSSAKMQSRGAVQGLTALMEEPSAQKEILKACAKHITPERLMRIARTAAQRQPELWQCTPVSFLGAIIDCAQMGLEPLPALGHVYLIPYNNKKNGNKEVQVNLGYKGMIAMALRSGKFSYITGDVICENDQILEYEEGLNAKFRLKPAFPKPRGDIVGAYAIAHLKNDSNPPLFKIVDMQMIGEARERSVEYKYWKSKGASEKGKQPIWVEHFAAMAIKTAIRRLSPFLAMAPEMQSFFEVDSKKESGLDANYSDIRGVLAPDNLIEVESYDDSELSNQSTDRTDS